VRRSRSAAAAEPLSPAAKPLWSAAACRRSGVGWEAKVKPIDEMFLRFLPREHFCERRRNPEPDKSQDGLTALTPPTP